MITIMGASGNTGRKIAEKLLGAGQKVRVLSRSEARLAELLRAGAQVLSGDPADAAFLTRSFRGAEAVYTMLPTDRVAADCRAEQDRSGEAIAAAIRDSGVRHVVALSSLGAELADGTGWIAGLHAQEERLRKIKGLHLLLLRPAIFFENFYELLDLLREDGIVGDAIPAQLALPMVATRDVAHIAAHALRARNWRGVVVRELLGPRDMTYAEAIRILGMHIGRPDVRYVQTSYERAARSLIEACRSESFASLHVELTRAFAEQMIRPRRGRTPENTTPTRFEDFAGDFAQVYAAAA